MFAGVGPLFKEVSQRRIPQRFQRPSKIDSFLASKRPNRLVLTVKIDSLPERTVVEYQRLKRLVLTEAAQGFLILRACLPFADHRNDHRNVCGVLRGGPGCLNRISASISGASAKVRLPSGVAAG